ncbi:helix-turn-helix domain-containing protein [Streptococcus suis]|uniref:helix-turn-helix domain-containing protein n=1 Tax=Streptococcus suis TaxID=1307 RepID=UPI0015575395|nr:helix-turn-helix transcriptional regulator [Streptococcus suis]NQJ61203.1 helix-turn-helix transcriptional regulator [Streptococcus suis]NQJ65144.1 helix-turn-helix transcriptional regulator [Streptococcus suis]UUM45894.1 helix-turn-helix domain-containing protein [Streptococcus suis]HEL2551262.1 helix-turn-helix transcriptional regulator [Streptococcus suis]HEM4497497.1 helix-turn-helix transcriptional regulator [Streptococcus suis]
MSQQHQKWLELVAQKMQQKGWSRSDLAQVAGVSPAMITRLLKEGHGSDEFKLLISKKLNIREPWEEYEEVR